MSSSPRMVRRGRRTLSLGVAMIGSMAAMGLGAGVATAEPAPASASPLLVVVETGPGAGCDGAAVRGAIEAELKARVSAPAAPPVVALAAPRSDILLVAVDRDRIVVRLRGRGDRELTRSIAAPAERGARLRAVAWLAGNVARDQLSTLTLPAVPAASAPPASVEPAAAAAPDAPPPAAPTTEPPPEVVPPPAPISREAPASGAATPATIVRQAPPVDAAAGPRWTLGADVGLAAIFSGPFTNVTHDTRYREILQVEGQRHLRAPFFVGAALDLGPVVKQQWGLAALAGIERRSNDLFLSVSLGAGINVTHYPVEQWVPDATSQNGGRLVGVDSETDAMFYGRVAIEFGLALSRTLDLMTRLNGHLNVTEKYNPEAAYVGAALGVRMRFY